MSLDDDMGLLAKVGLFQGFTPDQLRLLAFGAEREHLASGEALFAEGDAAEGGYVVAFGHIDLLVRRGRRQVVIESVEEGGLVGEIAMIAANRRATDAVARVDSDVLFITRPLFLRLLREYPETAAALHAHIAYSVRQLTEQLSDVHGRLGNIGSLAELKALGDADEPVGGAYAEEDGGADAQRKAEDVDETSE